VIGVSRNSRSAERFLRRSLTQVERTADNDSKTLYFFHKDCTALFMYKLRIEEIGEKSILNDTDDALDLASRVSYSENTVCFIYLFIG